MKIAVTYENGQVFQHFGHTETFKVYEVENGKIQSFAILGSNGSGHSALAGMLRENLIDTLICGGIGGARQALARAGVTLYGGVSGDADKAVEALLVNRLDFNPDEECAQHAGGHDCAHGDAHTCGEDCHSHN